MDVIASGLQFPEGPVALPDGSILLVEVARGTVTRVRPGGAPEIVAEIPGGPNGLAVGPDGRVYVCNHGGIAYIQDRGTFRPYMQDEHYVGGSIHALDLRTGAVETLYRSCGEHPLKGPNDLVFDRHGGFYFTDIGKRRARDMDRGFVYHAQPDGSSIRQVIGPIMTPNGIGLSPDGSILYVAETETGRLWAWDVTGPGELRLRPWPSPHGGTLVLGRAGFTRFDSLAVMANGNVCVAALHSACVVEVSPDGARVVEHPVPDLGVTNLCFGGPDMRTAYVTLGHEGKLVAADWAEPGLVLNFQDAAPDVTR